MQWSYFSQKSKLKEDVHFASIVYIYSGASEHANNSMEACGRGFS